MTILFDATNGAHPEGLSMRVVRKIFQRLYSETTGTESWTSEKTSFFFLGGGTLSLS